MVVVYPEALPGDSCPSSNISQPSNCDVNDDADFRYERIDKLGEGTYGIVYRCRDKETNEVITFHETYLTIRLSL